MATAVETVEAQSPPREEQRVVIRAPKIRSARFTIIGTSPLVIHAFGMKAREQMRQSQLKGQRAAKGKLRESRDFDRDYQEARHISHDGWDGLPATAIRSGLISVCRLVGYKMTLAKLSLFVQADGYDRIDGTPLIRITKGKPRKVEHMVRNDNGSADIRVRAMWDPGWEAALRLDWDADQFSIEDVANLLLRLGTQAGICSGRNDSKFSAGMGWGAFAIKEGDERGTN